MIKNTFYTLVIGFSILTNFSFASKWTPNEAIKSLNNTKTLLSDFIQYNSNGSTDKGKFYMLRPGNIKITYTNKPIIVKTVNKNKYVQIKDTEKDEKNVYPTKSLPLFSLFSEKITLEGLTVDEISEDKNYNFIRISSILNQPFGTVTIFFSKNNYHIIGWDLYNNDGRRTIVELINRKINKNNVFIEDFYDK